MTPKQQYDTAQAAKRRARMATDERWEATQKREKMTDEALTAMFEGVKAFFEGSATLHIEKMYLDSGHKLRFVKTDTR